MAFDKNSNLAEVITSIGYLYPSIPSSIIDGTDKYHKQIFVAEHVTFNEIYFTPGTAKFSESDKDDPAGGFIEQELKCIVPGEDDDTPSLMDALRGQPLLLCIGFINGTKKLMGLAENPAKLSRKQQISDKLNAAELTFYCASTELAWWISYIGVPNN